MRGGYTRELWSQNARSASVTSYLCDLEQISEPPQVPVSICKNGIIAVPPSWLWKGCRNSGPGTLRTACHMDGSPHMSPAITTASSFPALP